MRPAFVLETTTKRRPGKIITQCQGQKYLTGDNSELSLISS